MIIDVNWLLAVALYILDRYESYIFSSRPNSLQESKKAHFQNVELNLQAEYNKHCGVSFEFNLGGNIIFLGQ